MTKRRSTAHEIVTMKTVLSDAGQMVDGSWRYKPSWSDERVAKAVNVTLNANHAKHVRRSLFGDTRVNRQLPSAPAEQPTLTPLHNPPLRQFKVTDVFGKETVVHAHFVFDNSRDGEGLIFRRKNSHDERHDAVAFWPNGQWISVVRVDA